jgi:hypothetical protein
MVVCSPRALSEYITTLVPVPGLPVEGSGYWTEASRSLESMALPLEARALKL